MKRKLFATVVVMALALSLGSVPAMAANVQTELESISAPSPRAPTYVSFYGNSNTYYYVNFNSSNHIVGWNYTTSGNIVKVCQAFLKAAGCDPNGIDGIFGNNTNTALWNAQKKLGVQQDGICGLVTWSALYDFIGGVTPYVKSLL